MPICTKINGKLIEIDPKVQYEGITQTPCAIYAKINGEIRELWNVNDTDDVPYVQVFTETTTVTVPKGATAALISGCGAGSTNYAGASVLNWYTPVTEGEEIVCTVGKTGETGGDSSFGSYITLQGATATHLGSVALCRNLSEDAETPFGKSNTSGYGAAGRDGLLIIKWITENTGIVLTESQTIVIPEKVTGVLVSGCGGGGPFIQGGAS